MLRGDEYNVPGDFAPQKGGMGTRLSLTLQLALNWQFPLRCHHGTMGAPALCCSVVARGICGSALGAGAPYSTHDKHILLFAFLLPQPTSL